MLVISSNAAPSVVVNVRIPGHLIDENFVFGMSYGDKQELYDLFRNKEKEEWAKDERIIEMVQTIRDILIEDRDALITFKFDDEFIENIKKEDEMKDYIDSVLAQQDNSTEDDFEEWLMQWK